MEIFTFSSGAKEGAIVTTFTLKGGDKIPVIKVGESGRGRSLGVLPVKLLPASFAVWQETGQVEIRFAELAETGAGNPKLIESAEIGEIDKFIGVFRTGIGFRGGNSHTGDRHDTKCVADYSLEDKFAQVGLTLPAPKNGEFYTEAEAVEFSAKVYGDGYQKTAGFSVTRSFYPFPEIKRLASGTIAQGDAGGMGSGSQIVAVMPVGRVFRASMSGRLYGQPGAYYYLHDGEKMSCMTWEDREVADLW